MPDYFAFDKAEERVYFRLIYIENYLLFCRRRSFRLGFCRS
jgi:hypothetical protein